MKESTRQDFADNGISDLFKRLIPENEKLKRDIETIGTVRATTQNHIIAKKIINGKSFTKLDKQSFCG